MHTWTILIIGSTPAMNVEW